MSRLQTYLLSLSTAKRLAVYWIAGVLGGSSLLGIASEYATYWYAFQSGIRPPVEGIPYLAATVVLASVIVTSLVSSAFFLTRAGIGVFVHGMHQTIAGYLAMPADYWDWSMKWRKRKQPTPQFFQDLKKAPEELSQMPFRRAFSIVAVIAALFSSLGYIAARNDPKTDPFLLAAGLSFTTLLVGLTLWKKEVLQAVSALSAIGFYGYALALMFTPSAYATFLREIHFGGEIPVQVVLQEPSDVIEMTLFLRSRDALIGRIADSTGTTEIPLQRVRQIVYLQAPRTPTAPTTLAH